MAYTQLGLGERYQIYELLKRGFSVALIAEWMRRSRSTIYRELRRNRGGKGWRPLQAYEITHDLDRHCSRGHGVRALRRVVGSLTDSRRRHRTMRPGSHWPQEPALHFMADGVQAVCFRRRSPLR